MQRSDLMYIVLYILTFISTWWVGGPWYAITLMAILTAHELGHFLMSSKYGVPRTLPLFLPLPLPPFGTLGAIIRMKGTITDRKALFDIGAAGPLAGLAIAIPAIILGLRLSQIVVLSQLQKPVTTLGDSLMFTILERLTLGKLPPGYDVVLHPVAFAGWVGLFVTALNLLPIGQLDGGHILFALFGLRGEIISKLALLILAAISIFYNPGWLLLVVLLLLFGIKHPPPLDYQTPLDPVRRWLGIFILIIFVLSFTPVPFPEYVETLKGGLSSF